MHLKVINHINRKKKSRKYAIKNGKIQKYAVHANKYAK